MLHNTFTDVCCCLDPAESGGVPEVLTLVLSQGGQLLQINAIRCVTKWVDLKVSFALSSTVISGSCRFVVLCLTDVRRVIMTQTQWPKLSIKKFVVTKQVKLFMIA